MTFSERLSREAKIFHQVESSVPVTSNWHVPGMVNRIFGESILDIAGGRPLGFQRSNISWLGW